MLDSKKAFSYLVILSLILLLSGIHSYPLTDRDEGEYAACALEMLNSGDFIVPHLNGRPYLEKPPLYHWILASFFKIFGANEFSARLPSALSSFFLICIAYSFTKFLTKDKKLAIISGFILVTNPLFLIHARACITDMVLTLFIFISLFSFYTFMENQKNYISLWLISSTFISLAFLTKGPISFAIFLPITFLYAFFKKDFKFLKPIYLSSFTLIFLFINLPWHILIYKRLGSAFFETFYITQNLNRFTTTLLGHGGGPFFYMIVLLIGFFPYASHAMEGLITGLKKKENNFYLFCITSFCWIFILLSISATKQPNYILPAIPFLAIITGKALAKAEKIDGKIYQDILFLLTSCLFLILFILPIFLLDHIWNAILNLVKFDSTAYAFSLTPPNLTPWCIIFLLLIIFLAISYYYWKDKLLFFSGALVFNFIISVLFLPSLANTIQGPAKLLVKEVYAIKEKQQKTNPNIQLISYGLWKPSMIFYANHPIKRLKVKHLKKLNKELNKNIAVFVFTRMNLLKKLKKESRNFFPLKIKGGYMLGGNNKAKEIYHYHF